MRHLHVPPRIGRLAAAVSVLVAGWSVRPAAAITRTWTGPTLGSWNTAGNWDPTGVPTSGDDAVIDVARTVRLFDNGVAGSLNMSGGPTLLTRDFRLTISGNVQLSDNNTRILTGPLGVGEAPATVGGTTAENNASALVIGPSSSSTVNVLSGASMRMNTLSIGTRVASGTTYTVNVRGSGSVIEQSSGGNLIVGHDTVGSGTGVLNIGTTGGSGATFTTGSGAAEITIGRTGQINVGSASTNSGTLNARGNMSVRGTLNVNATGILNLSSGRTISVQSQGTLNLNRDFTLLANRTISIGQNGIFNANGDVVVDGGTLQRTGTGAINLAAGRDLTVQNGGQFDSGSIHFHQDSMIRVLSEGSLISGALQIAGLGSTGNGTLVVDGPGSTVTADAGSGVPRWGVNGNHATVEVRNGAAFEITRLSLADDGSTGTATITVDGSGSNFAVTTTFLHPQIGHDSGGSALINVRNGAVFTATGGEEIPININATGQLNVESGALFEAPGDMNINGGTVNLTGGTILVERIQFPTASGTFNFTGGKLRLREFGGNLVNQGGTVHPRPGAFIDDMFFGGTTIFGNYIQQPAGTLEIDIGGVIPGQWDAVRVLGNAGLAGTIKLTLVDGFAPHPGNSFTILGTEFGNVGGRFEQVEGSLPLPGVGLAVTYGLDFVRVSAAIPGDVNLDGQVTIADLGILAANWQQAGKTWLQADFNGDGVVTIADLGILAANWQAGVSGSGPAGPGVGFEEALGMFDVFDRVVVPEPGVVSAIAALGGLLALRRGRCGHLNRARGL